MRIYGTFMGILASCIVSIAFGAPNSLTYQGRIVKSDGQPLEFNNVSFHFEVTSPDGLCVIYREQVNGINMENSKGVFDIAIGEGTQIYPGTGSFTLLDTFNNSAAFTCDGGAPYTPAFDESRKLRVKFHDGVGWKTISPDTIIRSVPYAAYAASAAKLGDHAVTEFLLKTGLPVCGAGTFLSWNGSALSCAAVAGASGGTVTEVTSSNAYLTVSNTTSTPLLTLNVGTSSNTVAAGNDARFTNSRNPTGSASGDLSGTYPNPSVAKIQGQDISASVPASGQFLKFSATQWTPASIGTSDVTGLNALLGTYITSTYFNSTIASANCAQHQTMYWNSATSTFLCQNINVGLAGDASGTIGAVSVDKIKGVGVDFTVAPTNGQFLKFNGTNWVAASDNNAGGTITALTGDVSASGSGSVVSTVNSVGGSTAVNVHNAELLANAATNLNTASAIVKRDPAGNFAASDVTVAKNILKDSGSNTVTISAPTTVTTSYALKMPAAQGANNQVLVNDGSGNLSWAVPAGTGVASVAVTAPITNSGTATAPNIGIPAATTSANGYLTSTDWNAFNGKQGTALNSGLIWVGNSSNVATARALSGDVVVDNVGATTVQKIRATGVVSTSPTATNNILKFIAGNWTPGFIDISDIRSTAAGNGNFFPTNCTAAQTLVWQSLTDNYSCANIAISDSQITYASKAANLFLASPSSGSGAPAFRAITAADLPAVGITSLNGLTGNVQTFGIPGTTGTAPTWTSAGSAHTLNIPLASTAGVTAGLISKTDYDAFNTKLGTATSFSGDVSGAYNATSVNKIKGVGIDFTVAPTSGQFLKYNGTSWIAANDNNAGGTITALTGDVSASGTGSVTSTVNSVAGSTAANVHAAELLANAATSLNTASAIVKRDASGNFAASEVTVAKSILKDSGSNTVTISAPTTVTTSYTLKMPAAQGANNQVLVNDGAGNLSWAVPAGTGVASVAVTAPITNSGTATAPNIGIPAATTSVNGYLTSTDWNTFNNKLGTATTFSGDISGAYNTTSVDKIKGKAVSATAPTSGQFLVYNGTTQYVPVSISGDATMTSAGALSIAAGVVGNTELANMAANTLKGNITGGAAAPTDVTIASLQGTTATTFAAGNDSRITGALQTTGGTLTGMLTLATGTTTLSPLRIPAGTLVTTPVSGNIESDGASLYYTNSTPTRQKLASYTGTPANGQLLIGNGSGFNLANITQGAGVTITNSAGGITIAATGSGGTVTAVSSANSDIAVATGTATPVLTLNSGTTGGAGDANKIAKLDASGLLTAAMLPNHDTSKLTSGTLPIARGGTNSATALSNNRIMASTGGAIVEAAAITASRALISDANGIPTHSAVTNTELGYLSGVTSAVQTQINGKASSTGWTNYSAIGVNGSGALTAVPGAVSGSHLNWTVTGPAWTTAAFPTSTTANQLLYSSANNVVGGLATANNSILTTNGSGVPTWGTISSDVFSQYALLAGRSGGQTLNGGTAASNNLTLDSTAHATKGNVLINPTGGNVGIGTTSPLQSVHIKSAAPGFFMEDTTGGADNEAFVVHYNNVFQIQNRTTAGALTTIPYQFDIRAPAGTLAASSAGNVGIGTATPLTLLELSSSTGRKISFSPATVSTGETKIEFRHNDNGNNNAPYAAVNGFLTDGSPGQNAGQLRFYTAPLGAGNPSLVERMRIDPAGNVGIGTSTPRGPLHIKAPTSGFATGSLVLESNTGTSAFGLINAADKFWIGSNVNWSGGYPQIDYYPRFVVDSNGYVGIGTSAPTAQLQVVSTGVYSTISNYASGPGGADWRWYSSSSAAPLGPNAMCFGIGTCLYTLYSTGNATLAGTLTQGSDIRWKRDITSIDGALDSVMKLEGVSYYWKDPNKEQNKQIGLIAQSVEKVFPEAVKTDAKGYKSVAYQNLVAPLINAIHELKALIDGTHTEVAVLKEEVKLQNQEIDKLKRENEQKAREFKEIKELLCVQNPNASFCR